jgi:hypothetical protein
MSEADIIAAVKQLRRIVTTLDTIGFPTKMLSEDDDLGPLVPKGLPAKIVNVAGDIHHMLVGIEKSQKYKNAIKNLCEIKERP